VPNAADVRQSAVPHETLSRKVIPSHPIMITKGNNIAGEVACLRKLLGDALGFPFEVGIARAIMRVPLAHCATQLQVFLLQVCSGAVSPV
jgi:hypothetical protein